MIFTLISNTQMIRLVCAETRFRTNAAACHLPYDQEKPNRMESASRHLAFRGFQEKNSWETGGFFLSCSPRLSRTMRLVIRLHGRRGSQVLIDADLEPLSPSLPDIYQAAARADWNGQEILFPKAGSVALWQDLYDDEGPAERFGCTDRQSGQRYAFLRKPGNEQSLLTKSAASASGFCFHPLSGSVPLDLSVPGAFIQCGRWFPAETNRNPGLLGFQISRNTPQ